MYVFDSADSFVQAVGTELGTSDWFLVEQDRVDKFAEATGDLQWIHVDPERAADGPFGGTIAHGFFILSLLVPLMKETFTVENRKLALNYGTNKVRFPAPAKIGMRIRVTTTLTEAQEVSGGVHVVVTATVNMEGAVKPVCVAETVTRHYF